MRCELFSTTFFVLFCYCKAATTPARWVIDSEVRPKHNDLSNVVENLFRKMLISDEVSDKSEDKIEPQHIWEWDSWCHLQPLAGNCKEKITRYYYDVDAFECKKFIYTGCNGNQNSFDTKEVCEEKCEGTTDSITPLRQDLVCTYQPNGGMCLALMEKYYYDVNERKCKKFIYGGCGGNMNRFNSWEQCDQVCGAS